MGGDAWYPSKARGDEFEHSALVVRSSPHGDGHSVGRYRAGSRCEYCCEGGLFECDRCCWISKDAAVHRDQQAGSDQPVELAWRHPGSPGLSTGDERKLAGEDRIKLVVHA